MKISVAMTTYNGEKYIIQQLDSIRRQTKHVNEVCIFDDKSCDSTVELVKNYILKYGLAGWSISVNEKNVGFIENFRKAIGAVSGDVIFLADQDDVWREDKVEVMTALLESHPEISVLASAIDIIDQNGKSFKPLLKPGWCHRLMSYDDRSLQRIPYIEMCRGNCFPGCTLCFRNRIKEKFLEFSVSYRAIEHDWAINICGSMESGLYYLQKPLLQYRIHGSNTIGIGLSLTCDDCRKKSLFFKNNGEFIDPMLGKNKTEELLLEKMRDYVMARSALYEIPDVRNLVFAMKQSFRAAKACTYSKMIIWNIKDALLVISLYIKNKQSVYLN